MPVTLSETYWGPYALREGQIWHIPTTDFLWKSSTLPTTNDNKYPLANQEYFPIRAFHFCVCCYSKDFCLNGNDTSPHIALVRAQDDSKGLGWILLTLPVLSNQRAAVFKQRIYLSYNVKHAFVKAHIPLIWYLMGKSYLHKLLKKIASLYIA